MTSDTEQALEEAAVEWYLDNPDGTLVDCLAAALPEGVVLTADGLARVERSGAVQLALAEWADGALIDPKTWTLWDAEYEDIGPSLALVLSPREGER